MKEISQTQYKVIEPVFMATFAGIFGAVSGGVVGFVIAPLARLNPRDFSRIQYARVCARGLGVSCAALLGTDSVMRGIRGKDDQTNQLVAASVARRVALDHIKRYHKMVKCK